MNLLGKFTLALLACGLAPLLLSTLFTHTITKRALEDSIGLAREALQTKAKDQVTAIVSAEKEHLKTFVKGIRNETRLLSQSYHLKTMLERDTFYDAAGSLYRGGAELATQKAALLRWYQERASTLADPAEPGTLIPPAQFLDALSPAGIAVQYRFLVERPDPVDFNLDTPPSRPTYADVHDRIQPFWKDMVDQLGYLDILLVDGERGDVIYSVAKNMDIGASLKQGPLAGTHAAKAYRQAWEGEPDAVAFADVAAYLPAGGANVCFVATPVFVRGQKKGVVLFEFGMERFDAIVGTMVALGKGGAVFLVGPDYRPRGGMPSALHQEKQASGSAWEKERIDVEPVRVVFHLGETGCREFTDAAGEKDLVAYTPVDILGITWALIAQVETAEAYAAVQSMEETSQYFVNRMLYLSDFIVLAAILVLCFVADYLAKPIVRPLRSTVAILKGMVQGEDALNQRLIVRGKDEVAELSSSFNRFMDKLQLLYSSLEKEVTERKRAQEEVESSQQYYKALIEFAPDVILVLGNDQTPKFLSPSFERTFGYRSQEFIGANIFDKVHPDDRNRLVKVREKAWVKPGAPMRVEYRFQHKDGHWVHVAAIGTNHQEDPNIAGTVVNMRDISATKEAEKILREYSATLERDVAERTIELQKNRDELASALENLKTTQNQLVLNEKMASLGALTAGIAHEIKNPLNFVTNFADLTAELAAELGAELDAIGDPLDAGTRANLRALLDDIQRNSRKIQEHGKRADSIVKTMLLHSRGKRDERQWIQVNELLEEYVQLAYHGMRAQDATFNIELELNLDASLPKIEVVPQDLARVFLNILNNGCYAANERKKQSDGSFRPKLTVSTGVESDKVVIRIRDNGDGIPPSIIEKVFTPFFTTKAAGVGTGLGLSISFDIVVQEHDGEIDVESVPGEYTEFIVSLPVVPRKEKAEL